MAEEFFFGSEAFNDEDRKYAGSTYGEVRDAIFANPYYKVWGAAGEKPFPQYEVTFGTLFKGMFGHGPHFFLDAVKRTVDSGADLRWGTDRKGFRRLIHPNGVCLTGLWEITENTPYSGYFRQGSKGLMIGRYSTCCTETRRGHTRSLALVGKLFPTIDPIDPTPARTASLITQQDIAGAFDNYINDAELRNAPDLTASRRGSGIPALLVTGATFAKADPQPGLRQLYQISEMGKQTGEPTRTPEFLRLTVAKDQPRIEGEGLDFRDEVLAQIFDRGDPTPRRKLVFDIEVTDDGGLSGPPIKIRGTFSNWKRIGKITFDNAVASYNGDFVLHFGHPVFRKDKNDPATAVRKDGQLLK